MRAGWILLEIRHKQYEVNVDEVGADSIRPRKSQQHKKGTVPTNGALCFFSVVPT